VKVIAEPLEMMEIEKLRNIADLPLREIPDPM
jgi:hypothetical protein